MLSIIVAMGQNNEIGLNNKLLWHLPEDLQRFKEITMGSAIIMGRKTFESIGRVLPNRNNIIVSKKAAIELRKDIEVVNDLFMTLEKYKSLPQETFVIGGGTIYEASLPYVDKFYITLVKNKFESEVFFPKLDYNMLELIEKSETKLDGKSKLEYEYLTYIRKK